MKLIIDLKNYENFFVQLDGGKATIKMGGKQKQGTVYRIESAKKGEENIKVKKEKKSNYDSH